ncbi:hypothetical protein QFZ63_000755 [Streptomyces sp. B3I7]|uniref:hypothetical protein n=1 Tax=unclassified Streptomyces TaxID=2593676 RepID=UPI002780B89B|nr:MULTISPECIES: hypothetical protein [unclassified Streptomyces]MDQ0791240.1 hypothetical protein [Streptomyces sp. B3I8]MDQ0809041.1 hypothetical protein [Streptomyces sp. B3I7]
MLSHALERGVLVLTVHRDPGPAGRAALAAEIGNLVHAYRPRPVVVVLEEPATGDPTVGAVLRAHRLCSGLGVLMSVSTHSAPARRLLEAGADTGGCRLVVHARTATAIDAAFAAAA